MVLVSLDMILSSRKGGILPQAKACLRAWNHIMEEKLEADSIPWAMNTLKQAPFQGIYHCKFWQATISRRDCSHVFIKPIYYYSESQLVPGRDTYWIFLVHKFNMAQQWNWEEPEQIKVMVQKSDVIFYWCWGAGKENLHFYECTYPQALLSSYDFSAAILSGYVR